MIKITHNAGFFSCCSVKLHEIVKFINLNKRLPDTVDSSKQFKLYKNDKNKDKDKDITLHYFETYNNVTDVTDVTDVNIKHHINYHHTDQFKNYSNLDYKCIIPLIKKYFSPSVEINEIVNTIENKYNIVHDNTLAVYYRGTDKYRETKLSPFVAFYKQIIEIVNKNKNIKILLQTDSAKFIDYISSKNLENVVIIDENKTSYVNKGIHNEETTDTNYYDMFNFLSTILILSKCKYIICSSGNCSIWTMLYRGNNKNVIQYLKGMWYGGATPVARKIKYIRRRRRFI